MNDIPAFMGVARGCSGCRQNPGYAYARFLVKTDLYVSADITAKLSKRYLDRGWAYFHRRRSGWNYGGYMARGEGGLVPSGLRYGEGCPLFSRLGCLGERRELPQRGPGAIAENGFWRILKATERSFVYLHDKICGGQFALSAPTPNSGETCPPVPPVIYAHAYFSISLYYVEMRPCFRYRE